MKASGGQRAGAIRGKVKRDPGAAGKIGKAKPAAAAAKPATGKRRNSLSPEKVLRIVQRVNNVTANAASKSGVKRMNATEAAVRAKSFLTRKAGGMSGMTGKSFDEQQSIVRSGITTRRRYSTGTPNRNKPLSYNALGQDRAREKARIESRSAREKIAAFNKKPPAPKTFGRVMGRRELTGRNYMTGKASPTIKAPRIKSTIKKPSTKPKKSELVVRTRKQAKAYQRHKRESMLFQTRSKTLKNNPRIRRQQTGMSQLSLLGKAKPIVRFRPVRR
jgi:hypothetical protein